MRDRNVFDYICGRIRKETAEDSEAVFSAFLKMVETDLETSDFSSSMVGEAKKVLDAVKGNRTASMAFKALFGGSFPEGTVPQVRDFIVSVFASRLWKECGPEGKKAKEVVDRMEDIMRNAGGLFGKSMNDAFIIMILLRRKGRKDTDIAGRLFFGLELPDGAVPGLSERKTKSAKRKLRKVFRRAEKQIVCPPKSSD